jgi:outer membrane receptor protein involved in Fe transport
LGGSGVKGFGLGGSLGNENLKWEMTSEWNFGLDFGLFQNRISGNLDVYFRRTTDLIFQKQVAQVNGYSSILQNIGTTQNRGFEVTINSVNLSNKDFSWKTNFTFSLNRNKIIDLDGTKTDDLANRRFIGHPMNVYYDVKQIGIWQEDEKD